MRLVNYLSLMGMKNEHLMEKQLLQEVKQGTYNSFVTLYKNWSPRLYSFVFSLVKSKEIAQDILQETFITLWTHRTSINPECSFKSYLFSISYHLVLKEFKYKINHPRMSEYIELCNEPDLIENTTERKIDFDDFLERLECAKEKLTPKQKEVFTLVKEYNYSIAHTAQKLGINDQTVRNHLASAIRTLRNELREYLGLFLLFF